MLAWLSDRIVRELGNAHIGATQTFLGAVRFVNHDTLLKVADPYSTPPGARLSCMSPCAVLLATQLTCEAIEEEVWPASAAASGQLLAHSVHLNLQGHQAEAAPSPCWQLRHKSQTSVHSHTLK